MRTNDSRKIFVNLAVHDLKRSIAGACNLPYRSQTGQPYGVDDTPLEGGYTVSNGNVLASRNFEEAISEEKRRWLSERNNPSCWQKVRGLCHCLFLLPMQVSTQR
jgi:hypothetical protein